MSVREYTEKKVFHYIEEHCMLVPHDRIVAGISGGADSVCLFFLLLEYAKKVPLSLAVVHVNHGIRAEAGEDARYVETLCRQEGIPFFLTNADVHRMALEEKCSVEDMGRRVRYEAFRQTAEQLGGALTAVAHNSNDNAETMLFHLFRGSGLKGLGGIAPVRNGDAGKIIRPILCLERAEVEAYLRERQIAWCTDETNRGDAYCRNRIRHNILPYAEQEIVQGAIRHMCQTAGMLRETEDYLEQQTLQALGQCVIDDKKIKIACAEERKRYVVDLGMFQSFHEVLQKRMLLTLLKKISPGGKDISMVHIQDAMSLVTKEGSHRIHLPYGIVIWQQYGRMIIERRGEVKDVSLWDREPVMVSLDENRMDFPHVYNMGNGWQVEFAVIFRQKGQKVPENQYTKWFDYDKIKEPLVIRPRRTGDFLTIADGTGRMRHKSLKDYMITEKIPRQFRNEIPMIAAGNHILWLVGCRISEYFKVEENTKRVLQVKLLQNM